jgi:hypothetical protein
MADAVIVMALASRDAANRKELSREQAVSPTERWGQMAKPPLASIWSASGGEFKLKLPS